MVGSTLISATGDNDWPLGNSDGSCENANVGNAVGSSDGVNDEAEC